MGVDREEGVRGGLSFLESGDFPIGLVNEASAREKVGGGRPPYWEMVFWWTRKPLISARAVVAGALLPHDFPADRFARIVRLDVLRGSRSGVRSPHRLNPAVPPDVYGRYFKGRCLLDPFAGFGSIPLEALRLGLSRVVAVELLPTAYVFLKAVLEYPTWAVGRGLRRELVEDVGRWGRWVAERLREDPDVKELYEEGAAVYIGIGRYFRTTVPREVRKILELILELNENDKIECVLEKGKIVVRKVKGR